MRTILLFSFVLVGGALVTFGLSLESVWTGVPGLVVIFIAVIVWIMPPAKRAPVERSGRLTRGRGNRPTHDPTDFVGWE